LDEKGRHIEERSSLQGKSVGQKLDEKEYGLEVGWKRRYIERRSSLNEQNMDKKLDEKKIG
jgi:hypothetical protein